ncbi:MAG: ATP-binding protein [Mangrovimonas sp.]|nr:ATP-binding protein [Mangrovimonas sp.]MCB0437918.1 ATP-binding protein [Mangrovimonas sp.]
MDKKVIVITGGPGTGKSSCINALKKRGLICFEEISREVTKKAQAEGIDQLFLTQPLLFSELLLKGREQQYREAQKHASNLVFLDRGIPDVLAYMDFIGDDYPENFTHSCKTHLYSQVFILAPWQEIYQSDNERYENFDQAVEIHHHLIKTYQHYNYELYDVPFGSIEKRVDFILNTLK